MFTRSLKLGTLFFALMFLAAPLSYADPIIFNMTAQNTGQVAVGAIGNSMSFTNSGLTVTATAWANVNSSSNVLAPAALGRFGSGLGVCDASELPGCANNSSSADNIGTNNWILFTFSEAVDPTTLHLYVGTNVDWDLGYRVGNITSSNLTGESYFGPDTLAAGGFGAWQFVSNGPYPYIVPISNVGAVNAIFVGAAPGDVFPGNIENDGFKIQILQVNAVPEPTSLLLLGSGLVAFAGAFRKKRQ